MSQVHLIRPYKEDFLPKITYYMKQSPWYANSCSASWKIRCTYKHYTFNTVFTSVCHLSCSEVNESTPHPSNYFFKTIIMLFFHLYLYCQSGLPSLKFCGHNIVVLYISLPPTHDTCPTSPMLHDLIILTISAEKYKLWSS